jgi:uncharacterized protein YfaS (alpha-2-macroglobulin family)
MTWLARPRALRFEIPLGRAVLIIGLVLSALPAGAVETSRMTGRVIDADTQQPIAGADVEVSNQSGGQGYFRARTNARGEFAMERVPSGRWYSLSVGARSYADFVLAGWQFPATQRLVDLVIPLDRAGSIDVKLTRSDGRTPVAGARVAIVEERGDRWWESYRPPPQPRYTDARGVARFEGLTAGHYTVTADVSGLRPAESRRVTVRRGETTSLPLIMTRPATISGTVKLADATPVAGVPVTARGPGEAVGTTDAEGNFSIGDLAPGRFRLDVSSDGLEPFVSHDSYSVPEGGSREGIALTVTPKPPEFALVVEREAFLPEATIRIGVRSFRIDALDITVYHVPDALLLDATQDFRRFAVASDTTGLARVDGWRHIVGTGPEWTWREGELVIPRQLPPGAYVLRASSAPLVKSLAFFVTDLGVLIKRSGSKILVSAAALRNGRPIEDARVYAIPAITPSEAEGQGWSAVLAARKGVPPVSTDVTGLVTIPTPNGIPATLAGMLTKPPRLRIVALSEDHGLAVAEVPLAPAVEQGGDKLFLYADRPIYRPGHTVYWKAFVRRASDEGYVMPTAKMVTLKMYGPDGASVDVQSKTLSEHGSADGAVELPKELKLGDWSLTATAGAANGAATFAVQEYRKPEFSVDVTPDREVYVNGDEVRFRIVANYFFGSPVFGATVRYNLFETRLRGEWNDWDYMGDEGGGYGRVLKSGETRTDLDGRADVVLTPDRAAYDRRLTLEIEVVDASNRAVSGRGTTIVGRGLFTLSVRPRSWVVRVGEPVPLEIVTVDHSGKPVSAAVTVTLDQDAWNPLTHRYTRSVRPLATTTVTTSADGKAQLSLTPSPARPGDIEVNARADDAKGNRITAHASIWAWDEAVSEYAYRYPALEVLLDRKRYRPGDTARVIVNTEVQNALVLATLEGRDLYEVRSLALRGGTGIVAFPLRPEYAPNAFVSVHVRKGREVHTRTIEIPIEAERHDLAIALKPDRAQYGPGDSARVDVETRDGAGHPVPAEVSVGVVDEAIYSLRADATPDPHDVFYGRRPNWVSTVIAFPSLLLGGADKGGREEPRRDFRDVALWAPAVATGLDGRGSVTLRYPDNLTTWRITSRGLTDQTLVGRAVAKSLVTKDIVARLSGPRFLIAGDEAALVSVVNNRTDKPIPEGQTSIEAKLATLVGKASGTFTASARGESRVEWRVRAPSEARGDDAVFTFRARTKTDSDALEVRVPVRPRAVKLRPAGGGVLNTPNRTFAIPLPQNLVRFGSEVTVDVSLSPLGMALAGAEHLMGYPYGCTEQTANAVIAATAVLRALDKAPARPPGWEKPAVRLKPYLTRLAANMLDTGGWGWWKQSDLDPYLTALALDALARAVRLDLAPAEARQALISGAGFSTRVFAEVRSLDGEAYMLAHLSSLVGIETVDQSAPMLKAQLGEVCDNLYASRKDLGNAGLALAARGFHTMGRAAQARELVLLLLGRGVKDGNGMHWSADPVRPSAWFGEDLDATGYALSAVALVAPQDTRTVETARWLAAHRTGMGWRSTRETAPVAEGLAEYAAARPTMVADGQRLSIEWNGEVLLARALDASDAFASKPIRVVIPGAKLKPGDNRLTLSRSGSNVAGNLFYAWDAKALVPSPGPEPPKSAALHVAREYLRAERTADRRGRPRYVATPLQPGAVLRVGEQVMVRLTLTASRDLDFLLVEDPRIAGFEVDALLPDGTDHPYGTNAEEHDTQAAFFIDHLESGDTVIEYLVRPELAGTFTALPIEAVGMYEPELLTRGGEAKVTVQGGK